MVSEYFIAVSTNVSNINVKNNFKKELFDVSKLHRNESGKWTISGCTGNKYLKEINLYLFEMDDDEIGNAQEEFRSRD